MNKFKLDKILDDYNNLIDDIRRIGEYIYRLRYERGFCLKDLDPGLCNGYAHFNYNTYFRGEYDDTFSVSFPLEYLWTENYQEIEKGEI